MGDMLDQERKMSAERDYARRAGEFFRSLDVQPGALVYDRWSGSPGRVVERLEPQAVLLGFAVRWESGATTNTYLSALCLEVG